MGLSCGLWWGVGCILSAVASGGFCGASCGFGWAVGWFGASVRCGASTREFCAPVLLGVSFGGCFRGFTPWVYPCISRNKRQGGIFIFLVSLYPLQKNVDCRGILARILVDVKFRRLVIYNKGVLPTMWGKTSAIIDNKRSKWGDNGAKPHNKRHTILYAVISGRSSGGQMKANMIG